MDDYDELQKNKALKAQLDQIIAQADQGGLQTLLNDLKTVYAGVKTAQGLRPPRDTGRASRRSSSSWRSAGR